MAARSAEAAERLAGKGIDMEVIDLSWIRPLDVATVAQSVGFGWLRCQIIVSENRLKLNYGKRFGIYSDISEILRLFHHARRF